MNKRRLMLLVRKLESLPRKRFDYGMWAGLNWAGAQDLSCGTTACALGWATTIPSLQKAGLRLKRGDYELPFVCLPGVKYPDAHDSIGAAVVVFDLTRPEAEYLFMPEYAHIPRSATAKRVARHILNFVKRGGMPK